MTAKTSTVTEISYDDDSGDIRSSRKHPYLAGNFAPLHSNATCHSVRCSYTGTIPEELFGGQYVRNGSNPIKFREHGDHAGAQARSDYHWFDGDGMLCGVYFEVVTTAGSGEQRVVPKFTNQFVMTDVALHSLATQNGADVEDEDIERNDSYWMRLSCRMKKSLQLYRGPILPSMATLADPCAPLFFVIWNIVRSVFLVFLSWLPGSLQKIKNISVANTGICFHDGRALATCESGPPIRVDLPSLNTVGWFNGKTAEGEGSESREEVEEALPPVASEMDDICRIRRGGHCTGTAEKEDLEAKLGGSGPWSWMRAWTTGHPKVDPITGEMILFHNSFIPPYVRTSVIPPRRFLQSARSLTPIMNRTVPGCMGARMRHDFGVSLEHTVIIDVPLELTALNLVKNRPIVDYRPDLPARFGVFPRRQPDKVRWFETKACCIFHTANTWDQHDHQGNTVAVNMLACRMTSASVIYTAGNIPPSQHARSSRPASESRHSRRSRFFRKDTESGYSPETPLLSSAHDPYDAEEEADQCRLYLYQFCLYLPPPCNRITNQYALSPIPFEFPTINPTYEMTFARYIYGCSTTAPSFPSALGSGTKIDVLVKFDIKRILDDARPFSLRLNLSNTQCADKRSVAEILASADTNDKIKAFRLPPNHYAQEARFVARRDARDEDDGFLLFYVFDEGQLDARGECRPQAVSELWILDARNMRDVIGKVRLPVRVPYGLHGNWFSKDQIKNQRGVARYRTPG